MNKYTVTAEADNDLDEIWEFIAQDDIDAADRWDLKLRAAFEILALNPHAGHLRKDLTGRDVRFWPVGRYLVIYRCLADHIEILAVTQGARDIPDYLRKRS